jgi:hypothetical protein
MFAALVLVLSAWIYQQWFYENDLKNEGWLRLKLERLNVHKNDILFLGASPNSTYSLTEKDQRSIVQMMMDDEPGLPIVSFDTGALHAGIFADVLKWIEPENLPETVICELNFRSFSAEWIESELENSLQRNSIYMNRAIPMWNRARVVLKDYPWVSPAERRHRINNHFRFDRLPFSDYRRTIFHWFRELEKRYHGPPGMAGEYVKKFGLVLDSKNPRIRQYDEVAAFCKKQHIRLIFVLFAENVQEAEMLVGKDLTELMHRNVDFLVKRYNTQSSEVVNCFDEVSDDQWFERNFITEHYLAEGRHRIATAILKQLLWKSGKHS